MEEKALLNKKIIMLAILFVSVLAIAQVSAAENATDVVNIEDATEVIALDNENVVDVNDLKNDKENSVDNHEILGIAESQRFWESLNHRIIFLGIMGKIFYQYHHHILHITVCLFMILLSIMQTAEPLK